MAERDWRRDQGRDREWEQEDRRWRGRGPQRSERYSEQQYGRDRNFDDDDRPFGAERQDRQDEDYDSRDRDQGWRSYGWGQERNRQGESNRSSDRQRNRSGSQMQPIDTTWSYYEFWLTPGPHAGRGPQGYRRNAERIKEDICDRLESHGGINAQKIQVDANDEGEVTLTGTVETRREKRLADDVADSVRGVRDVHNQLKVKTEESATSTPWSTDPARTGKTKT